MKQYEVVSNPVWLSQKKSIVWKAISLFISLVCREVGEVTLEALSRQAQGCSEEGVKEQDKNLPGSLE